MFNRNCSDTSQQRFLLAHYRLAWWGGREGICSDSPCLVAIFTLIRLRCEVTGEQEVAAGLEGAGAQKRNAGERLPAGDEATSAPREQLLGASRGTGAAAAPCSRLLSAPLSSPDPSSPLLLPSTFLSAHPPTTPTRLLLTCSLVFRLVFPFLCLNNHPPMHTGDVYLVLNYNPMFLFPLK